MIRTKFVFRVFIVLLAVMMLAPAAQADLCPRQQLAGEWVTSDPNPAPGDLIHLSIHYRCDFHPSTQWSIRPRFQGTGVSPIQFVGVTATPIGPRASELTPDKIAGHFEFDGQCSRATNLVANEFFHVIATTQGGNLHVLYRGKTCAGQRFQRQQNFRR